MLFRASPSRPALAPAALFLSGLALGRPPWTSVAGAAVAAGAALLAATVGRKTARRALLGVACLGAGAGLGVHDQEARAARTRGWLPQDGSAVETSVEGVLLRSAEEGSDGAPWLTVLGGPPRSGTPFEAAVLRLRVEPSSADRDASIFGYRRGDRVRCWCRIRGASEERPFELASRGLDGQGYVKTARLVERLEIGRSGPLRGLDAARAALRGRIGRAFADDPAARGVFAAMLLGDRSALDADGVRALRDGGLLHLLSISGLHVALVLASLVAVARRTPLRGPLSMFALVGSALAALTFFVGSDAPVLRSAAAAVALFLGRAIGRRGDAINTLAWVAAVAGVVSPTVIFNVGYQLSFAATAGILLWAAPFARAIPLPKPAALSLAVSAAAYLSTSPIVASTFGRLAPAGFVTNLVSAPLCAVLLGLGGAAALSADVPAVGGPVAEAAAACVRALFALCSWGAGLPGGSMRVPPPSRVLLVMLGTSLLALSLGPPRGQQPRASAAGAAREGSRWIEKLAALVAMWATLALHLGPPPPREREAAMLIVFDVGQGQSLAWLGPRGDPVLIDAGPLEGGSFDAGERIVVPAIAALGHRRLSALVLTHDHDDHVGGAHAVLREIEAAELWIPLGSLRDARIRSVAEDAVGRGVAVRVASRGMSVDRAASRLEFLHPAVADLAERENNRGAVVRLVAPGGAAALIPGDLESRGESRLLLSGVQVAAGVLVAGHHGAAGSTSEAFASAVRASFVVVSVGRGNRFGHPAEETLRRLRGTVRLRTDRDGSVRLDSDGGVWSVGATGRRTGWGVE